MKIFVDGFSPQIRTVVAHYREDQPRATLTYDRLVQYTRDEGDAYRACNTTMYGNTRPALKTVTRTGQDVTFKEPSSSRDIVHYTRWRGYVPRGLQYRHGLIKINGVIQRRRPIRERSRKEL